MFVSRVDTETDNRLETIGTDEALAARSGRDRQRPVAYEEVFVGGQRYEALKSGGARAQRPLWASTGVTNTDYSDTMYVTELIAPNTVNTMPARTLDAVADHGLITGDTVTGRAAEAQDVFNKLEALADVLEDKGVEKFATSWRHLLEATQGQLDVATR